MHVREFTKPITAKSLNESLAKRFGQKIKLENFSLAQLHDARNKIRTVLSQIEVNENYNAAVDNDSYQKNKMFLDVLNAEISERGDIDEAVDQDSDGDNDFDDVKIARMMASGMSKPEAIAKAKGKSSSEDDDDETNQSESIVREGAEDQAEIVMAAKEMVNRLTGWLEDTAEMQTESMLELADAIRDEMGAQQSAAYVDSVKPALEQLYNSMEQARGVLSSGVGMLTGEGEPMDAMGAEPAPAPEGDLPPPPPEDDFAAAPAAQGGEAPAGRPARESVDPRRLAKSLSKKK